ncbi:MAG: DUF1512 family protein [Promethearchaeota archaeon]
MLNITEPSEITSIIFNVLVFIMMFLSIVYGNKIRGWKSSRAIKDALKELKKWTDETRQLTISKFTKYCKADHPVQEIENKIDDFLKFVTITPVGLDPSGIIPKIEHILNNREDMYITEVRDLAINADEVQVENLGKLLEVTSAVYMVHRILLHYLLLGKKAKSSLLLQQVEMQLQLMLILAKAYVSASKSFAEGSPIGDSLGPMVVAKLSREISQEDPPAYEIISKNTILQKVSFEGRTLYLIRAKGPASTVGKPGTAITNLLEKHSDDIVRIITIDAGIKLEGDVTGSVVSGVGAAIGGYGVEKSKIEDASTKHQIPVNALICRQSVEDAICTMQKSIADSIPPIIEKTKEIIRRYTKENEGVIIAGIGNTMGIGI